MNLVDLKEIPSSHPSKGKPDTFELFARDFLEAIGFRIIEGPDRGADRGRDLIVEEPIKGQITETKKKWLVSVKHFAPSGFSVKDRDESDPIGRVRKFDVDGFMAFYSTIPSSGLSDTFSRIRSEIDIHIFDEGRICKYLISRPELQTVFQQYLPQSYERWRNTGKSATKVWGEVEPLTCCHCGKNILLEDNAVVVLVYEFQKEDEFTKRRVTDVYWACKGECDRALKHKYPNMRTDFWEDLGDIKIPYLYMRWLYYHMNRIRDGLDMYTDEAFQKQMNFITAMSQTVLKETTEEQWETINTYRNIFIIP